jgi:Right handed beta helix region
MIEFLESRIAPATFMVTNLDDGGAGSLRDAIAEANDHLGADVIVFKKVLTGTIDITSGQIPIIDTLTIKGPGATKLALDANFRSRFFFVSDGNADKDSPLTVSGLTFFRGKQPTTAGAGEPGGAIFSVESLNAIGCVFNKNAADGSGGAVDIEQLIGAPIGADIRNSSFVSNTNDNFGGGAIIAKVNGSVTLKNSLFSNNSARNGSTADLGVAAGETLLIQNCQFLGNHADRAGGASLSGQKDSTIIVRDSLFANNAASLDGSGGLTVFGGKTIIERSAFVHNASESGAGGVEVDGFSSLLIRSSQFLDNTSFDDGGGLRIAVLEGSEARVIASIISGNAAANGGGIVVLKSPGSLQIIGSRITNNHATGDGGGIEVREDFTTHAGPDVSVVRSKIIGNVSENANGGGIEVFGDGEFTMRSCQVMLNSSPNGGGVALFRTAPSIIIGSIIAQNTAVDGGGIFSSGDLELRATKVLRNTAEDLGGGIRMDGELTLERSTVSGNFALFGGGIFTSQDPEVKNSKVIGNFSPDGQQITVD